MAYELKKDIKRGIELIKRLYNAYLEEKLFDYKRLPEDILPYEMIKGSNEHLLYLTFVSIIAYLRKEERLWLSAKETYEDPETRYVFFPDQLLKVPVEKLEKSLKEYDMFINLLTLKRWSIGKLKSVDRRSLRENDLEHWLNMAGILQKYDSSIEKLFNAFDNDALKVIEEFSTGQFKEAFPKYHKERKVVIWLAKIKRNAIFPIKNVHKIPMASGAHIIRATFLSGSIYGKLNSIEVDLDALMGEYWNEVYEIMPDDFKLTPLEAQMYLWVLSKHGCSKGREEEICTMKNECPIKDLCAKGKFNILDAYISIDIHQ